MQHTHGIFIQCLSPHSPPSPRPPTPSPTPKPAVNPQALLEINSGLLWSLVGGLLCLRGLVIFLFWAGFCSHWVGFCRHCWLLFLV